VENLKSIIQPEIDLFQTNNEEEDLLFATDHPKSDTVAQIFLYDSLII